MGKLLWEAIERSSTGPVMLEEKFETELFPTVLAEVQAGIAGTDPARADEALWTLQGIILESGVPMVLTGVGDTILEDFARVNNRVNNIDPIEGMSMMDIASVCAAERRARGEPWRGKDAAGQPSRLQEFL